MAVDLYVGPLSRYYLGDWENVGQAWARQNGVPYKIVRPGDEDPDAGTALDPDTIRTAVCDWRDVIAEGLGENLTTPLDWEENPRAPYYTDRPHWDGYAGLLLLAAHEERPELDPPATITPQWRQDPAYKDVLEADFSNTEYLHVLAPELWLPLDFGFTFRFVDLTGHELFIGSAPRLLAQLRLLNERTYKGDAAARQAWRAIAPEPGGPFAVAACFGLAVFLDVVEQAIAHRLPLKLDY
jgi:hypothetical protein